MHYIMLLSFVSISQTYQGCFCLCSLNELHSLRSYYSYILAFSCLITSPFDPNYIKKKKKCIQSEWRMCDCQNANIVLEILHICHHLVSFQQNTFLISPRKWNWKHFINFIKKERSEWHHSSFVFFPCSFVQL